MLFRTLLLLRFISTVLRAGLTAIWMVGAAVVIFIAQIFVSSPEEKLRKLESPGGTGNLPEPRRCTHCATLNESTAFVCYVCGTSLS